MTVLAGAVRRGRPAQAGAAPARRHAAIDRRCRWLARAGAVLIGLLIALLAGGALNAELDAVASGRSASASADLADLAGAMADQEAALRAPAPPAFDRARAASDAARTELGRATLATGRGGLADRTAADAGAWEAWADAQRREAASGRPADAAELADGTRLFQRFLSDRDTLAVGLAADRAAAERDEATIRRLLVTMAVAGAAVVGLLLLGLALAIAWTALHPVLALAEAAERIAAGRPAAVREDQGSEELAELSGALRAWQETAAERRVLVDQAPVGICRLDDEGRVLQGNPALRAILGRSADQLIGRFHSHFLYPGHYAADPVVLDRMLEGRTRRHATELRYLRPDGTSVWCLVAMSSLRHHDGTRNGYLAVIADISARREQRDRAARIQRSLLPGRAPSLAGFQLAGMCVPADDVGGDFYDWVVTPDGHLDLTVADVMGKGIGAALVMATLRAALRTAPAALGPAARLRLAWRTMGLGADDAGLFVTVFQARLNLETGVLRYVDAGHGYWLLRRRDGRFASLGERSLPLGVGEEFKEGVVTLEPGDTLVVHSDGLVENDDSVDLRDFTADLEREVDATRMVHRLTFQVAGRMSDDVTVLVLRRQLEPAVGAPAAAAAAAAAARA